MRGYFVVALFMTLGFAAGCGGSSGGSTPVGVPTTVSLTPAFGQVLAPSQTLTITAAVSTPSSNAGVTWTLSGPGSLSSSTANPVTYTAPSSINANAAAVVTATADASTSATAYVPITLTPAIAGSNVAPLTINSGPAGGSTNIAFVSVTICEPGTTTCATVDDVQVDTGSEGLRILQSAIPSLSLPTLTDNSGNDINDCVQFLDTTYLWGPVQEADVRVNGEIGGQALLQVVSSSNSGIPSACTNGGTQNDNTPLLLGANGIIGIGAEPTDCILAGSDFCDGSLGSISPVYFSCPSSGCSFGDSPVAVASNNQVTNPVVLFPTDNQGTAITFPSLSGGAASLDGTLTFGIGTQANNALGSATVFEMDTNDNFVTLYAGQTLTASFIDSGSNALFFPSSIVVCADNPNFYCPAATVATSALNGPGGGVPTFNVPFSVDNADTLFGVTANTAFGTLGGPQGTANTCSNGTGSCSFDWGLPFFFGRTVFTAIDGQSVSGGASPFWAY